MSARMRVLHLFHEYLNITENWAFRIIDNLPDTDAIIGSKHFLKNNFYPSKLSFIEFPVKIIEQNRDRFLIRVFNALVCETLLRLYPWYITKMAGDVDLIHSHFSFVGWEYRKIAKRLRVPHIVSFYGFDYEWLPHNQPVWRKRYSTLFKEADLFLCEGHHGAQILEKIGCPPDKIKVIRLSVDVERIPFFVRDKRPGELNLLQIASLGEKKGHVYTVQAFMEALKECPDMTLTLVGGDSEGIRVRLHEMLRGTAAENRVFFIDRIDYDHLYEFMRDYDVFIHPSCYSADKDCEGGAPVVLLDAQATGMPIISTTHCDIPDEVAHKITGILTPEKDITALAQSIKRFYEMGSAEYGMFAQAARRHIETNYNAVRNAAELAAVYKQLLESFNK